MLVGNSQVSGAVLNDGSHYSAWKLTQRNKVIIFQVAESVRRRDPDSFAIVLKERLRWIAIRFTVSIAIDRNLSFTPPIQTISRGQPNGSVFSCQYGSAYRTRQPLIHRNRADGEVAKAVQAI